MENSEYENIKQKNKQKLVRNEFLYYGKSENKYQLPIIKKQFVDINKIEFLSYTDTKLNDDENKRKTIHFFTYDWKFEKVYTNAEEELEKLKQYYCLLSPDFSLFTNMPIALQIESVFKNRWCGAYWQSKGLKVIPTISWGAKNSYDFCFDGVEEGSIVAVCTYYRENCEAEFIDGYNEMLKRIKPSIVICYDEPFPSMKGNIKEFLPTTYEWTKKLNSKEMAQFKWEKHNRNIMGLDPKDFKYFEYRDPGAQTKIINCEVCNKPVAVDDYGNGLCENCGWEQVKTQFLHPDTVQYPNMVSLNKAKALYKAHKPLLPSIEDFAEALFMYGEMEFKYNGELFEVSFENEDIMIASKNEYQTFKTKRDFIENATIKGTKLKDLWKDVKNAYYML